MPAQECRLRSTSGSRAGPTTCPAAAAGSSRRSTDAAAEARATDEGSKSGTTSETSKSLIRYFISFFSIVPGLLFLNMALFHVKS